MMKVKLTVFVIFFYLLPYISFAQITDTTHIDEVIISSNSIHETIHQKFDNIEIKELKSHDAGDIFKGITGFGIVKKGNYAAEPVMRSFKYDQINFQYDGAIKVHSACPNRMDPITVHINPKEIESAEIIKGPFSVRFGQTMGGIINIVTKRSGVAGGEHFKGLFESNFESNGKNLGSNLQMNWVKKHYDILLSGGFKDYGNYKSGEGNEIASSFKNHNFSAKVGINLSDLSRINLGFHQNYSRDILYAGLPMDADYDNSSLFNIDYSYSATKSKLFRINAKLYGSMVDHVMSNKHRPNYSYSQAVSTVEAQSYGGKLELGYAPAEKLIIYSGVDFYHVAKDGSRERTIFINSCTNFYYSPEIFKTDLIWQNSYMNGYGIYTESTFELTKKLFAISGARIDFTKADILDPASDFSFLYNDRIHPEDEFNYSVTATLNYLINSKLSLQLAAGRGNRAPNLLERFINHLSVGSDAYEYVGNPNLISEKNNQIDLSLIYTHDNLKLNGNIFYSKMKDYITAKVDSSISRKFLPCKEPIYAKRFMNVDEVNQYGFESSIEYLFYNSWSFYTGISYTYAQNISWNEPLSEIPPLASNISLRYTSEKLFTELSARMVAPQKRISDSFNESVSEGFTVFNISANYKPYNWLGINISVLNIFDTNYYEHLSRSYKNMDSQSMFYEPGRNFTISVRLIF